MALAIILIILVVASVIFNFLTPWTLTELASNWGAMDTMLNITLLMSGLVFAAVTLFVVYAIIRFRHRPGSKAEYEPDNHRLEWWLLGITTVGIVALLAPGLVVYYDFVRPPEDAARVEIFGEQWRFSYRYPGEDGELGSSAIRHISGDNPLGLDPDDHRSHDDVVVDDALRLPVDRPVKVMLRSKDVIHSFFVPEFRAKMDMVPGMVTHFWFTPTRTGRFDGLCAQHCGVGHFDMRGEVLVMEEDEFDSWLAEQETFGEVMARADDPVDVDDLAASGRRLANDQGCIACHSTDGSRRVGPTWLGLYGSEVELADGRTITADGDYIRQSILHPGEMLTKGFPPVMQPYDFDEEQLQSIVAFIRALSDEEDVPAEEAPPPAEEPAADEDKAPTAALGKQLASNHGCTACHTTDGSRSVGPSWLGLYGRQVELEDGRTVTADADYIKQSITDPNATRTKGYPPVMQPYDFSDNELDSLVMYIRDELRED